MTWQLLNLWLQQLGYDVATIAGLSVMGLPYYARIFFVPFLESCSPLTRWHRNHWLGIMSLSAFVIGLGGLGFRYLLTQEVLPRPAILIMLGVIVNSAAICFEKSLALYKIECSGEQQRVEQLLHEKIGLKFGRWSAEAGALVLAWWWAWEIPYSLFSAVYLSYALFLVLIRHHVADYHCHGPSWGRLWDPQCLWSLTQSESSFLFFCLSISLADHITGYFLTLFLRDWGMNYLQIAQMAKIAGIAAVALGSWGGYMLRGYFQEQGLLFMACGVHLLSLMFLGWPQSLEGLWAVFFMKNMTLGAKIFLLSVFKSNYIAQRSSNGTQRRMLYFLTGFIKSLGLGFCLSFGLLYHHVPLWVFFMLASALSIPGLIMLGQGLNPGTKTC